MRSILHPVRSATVWVAIFLLGFSTNAFAAGGDLMGREWTFNVGGGYTPFVGGLDSQLTAGWNFAVGTEYHFNEKLGLLLEYGSHNGGVENGVLNRYSAMTLNGAPTDGTSRLWSVTLNPTWHFELGHIVGGYLLVGGGYYHARAQITTPGVALVPGYCDPYWGCWGGGVVGVDNIVAEHKDDTGGVNAGVGFTFALRRDMEFYIESRYHYVLLHGPDLQIIPFTAGFRF